MADEPKQATYTLEVGSRRFQFSSTDGESHIRRLEKKLTDTFAEVASGSEVKNQFNNASFKVALKLADEIIRKDSEKNGHLHAMESRIFPLIETLREVL